MMSQADRLNRAAAPREMQSDCAPPPDAENRSRRDARCMIEIMVLSALPGVC